MRCAVVLLVLLGSACTPASASAPSSPAEPAVRIETPPEQQAGEVPILGLELGLPRPPAFFEPDDVPVMHDDGTWSVLGLRSVLTELLPEADADRVVLVSAYVQEVYTPPVCTDQACPPGKMPHAWIVDDPAIRGKQYAMMVPGTHFTIPEWDVAAQRAWEDIPDVELVPGRRYVFMGWFRSQTDSGFAHDRGLLDLLAVAEYPLAADARWITPRNSPHHAKVRAELRMEPLEPELAHAPAGVVAGSPLPKPESLVDPSDRKAARKLGYQEADAGHPRRADYYFRWLIVDDPSEPNGWVELASFYVDQGEPDAGLDVIDLALERMPNDVVLHTGRGRLLLNSGEATAAVESYRRAIELAPDTLDALFGLGIAYVESGQRQLAIETLQRFLELAAVNGGAPDHILESARATILRLSYPD